MSKMATQIDIEELKGCESYFNWLFDLIRPAIAKEQNDMLRRLCRVLFETDFIYEIAEDGIRASDATEIRKMYAEKIGEKEGKNERETDRIWKSIHGKCSLMELIFGLSMRLDEMVNEGEEGSMAPIFFMILIENAGLTEEKAENQTEEEAWRERIERLMNRKYLPNGSGGGMFPLQKWSKKDGKDQRKVPVWYQMNSWLNENLDEDEHFMIEKFLKNDPDADVEAQ